MIAFYSSGRVCLLRNSYLLQTFLVRFIKASAALGNCLVPPMRTFVCVFVCFYAHVCMCVSCVIMRVTVNVRVRLHIHKCVYFE